MPSQKESHLAAVRAIQAELLQLLDGMDYCLDWKPDSSAWSAREVVCHLLDTPPGGFHRVLEGTLSGTLTEFDLWSDRSNMTPERASCDIELMRKDFNTFFRGMNAALTVAGHDDFDAKSVMVHQRNRGWDEARTAQNLLEGLFARHWREHLAQIRALRDALGL